MFVLNLKFTTLGYCKEKILLVGLHSVSRIAITPLITPSQANLKS